MSRLGFGARTQSLTSQSGETIHLQSVDSLDLTIIVENSIDILLPSKGQVLRPKLSWDWSTKPQLIAEHGYSALLRFSKNGETRSVLYDAGLAPDTALHNLSALGLGLSDVNTIVLSHGHVDHHGGLEGMVRKIGRNHMPLILHPDSWRNRKIVYPSGSEIHLPPPNQKSLEDLGVQIVEQSKPSLVLDDRVLVTGQVPRETDFESGFPNHYAEKPGGGWEPDTWIWDDQAIVCQVKGQGLIVLSSCSHSGVVNILHDAQRLTGEKRIHAFVGGMHLSGGIFEKIVPRTVEEVSSLRPDLIVPGHCSGWRAIHEVSRQLPEAYVATSVGTTMRF